MDGWLYIFRSTPYGSARFTEAIDALLVAGVFGLPVRVLLMGDAVQALRTGQDGTSLGFKTAGRQLTALPDYDIDHIYADIDDARHAGVLDAHIDLPVQFIDTHQQQTLIAASNMVFSD